MWCNHGSGELCSIISCGTISHVPFLKTTWHLMWEITRWAQKLIHHRMIDMQSKVVAIVKGPPTPLTEFIILGRSNSKKRPWIKLSRWGGKVPNLPTFENNRAQINSFRKHFRELIMTQIIANEHDKLFFLNLKKKKANSWRELALSPKSI